jgi:hypothetical protein
MQGVTSLVSRLFFLAAFVLGGLAVWEKIANVLGYTLLRNHYSPARMLDLSVVVLLFVIALQLREIKLSQGKSGSS